jgi:hypothetical protein
MPIPQRPRDDALAPPASAFYNALSAILGPSSPIAVSVRHAIESNDDDAFFRAFTKFLEFPCTVKIEISELTVALTERSKLQNRPS